MAVLEEDVRDLVARMQHKDRITELAERGFGVHGTETQMHERLVFHMVRSGKVCWLTFSIELPISFI